MINETTCTYHDGRCRITLAPSPAFPNIRTFGLLTDGVQTQTPQLFLDTTIRCPRRNRMLEKGWQARSECQRSKHSRRRLTPSRDQVGLFPAPLVHRRPESRQSSTRHRVFQTVLLALMMRPLHWRQESYEQLWRDI